MSANCEVAVTPARPAVAATRNACKLCTPLGACLAFAGIEGSRTVLHGSQGCATYIRRYMISHFKEPIDIASSSFAEETTIFGGRDNLLKSLANVTRQYQPAMIGIATTCLAETIGDDPAMHLRSLPKDGLVSAPIVHVSTPSYCGSHADGYVAAVRAMVVQLAERESPAQHVNLFAPMCSPADLRHLKEILRDFQLPHTLLPDYSDTLDGTTWSEYHLIPPGGTTVDDIRRTGSARASIEFTHVVSPSATAAAWLEETCAVPRHRMAPPIGVRKTDALFQTLESITGRCTPSQHAAERGRLLDSLVDGHKYVSGRRAAVVGDEDLVVGMAVFLAELGITPVVCGSGGSSGRSRTAIESEVPDRAAEIAVCQASDYLEIEEEVRSRQPDLIVGSSKAYGLARKLNVPLIRVGFPIHDRIDGNRTLHLGYRGAQQLFDRIANALIEAKQDSSTVGYAYM